MLNKRKSIKDSPNVHHGVDSKRRESMRRLLSIIVVGATTVFLPLLAMAANQDVADQIAQNLKQSGRLSDYRIAVKFQDGTATLKGRVVSQDQMNTAMKLVFKTPGVSRVVNQLTIGGPEAPAPAAKTKSMAQRVESSYAPMPVQTVSAMEPSTMSQPHVAARPIAQRPMSVAMSQNMAGQEGGVPGAPRPMYSAGAQGGAAPVRYDQPCMPNYAWPSYAAYPNYAAVTYPKQYSPTAWPYIGPFYPYPQVPLGWRKVTLEWKDGWWFLDFRDAPASCWR
jgi:hypothetical protein